MRRIDSQQLHCPSLLAPAALAAPHAGLTLAAPPAAADPDLNLFTGQRLEQRSGTLEEALDRGLYFYGARWYDSARELPMHL